MKLNSSARPRRIIGIDDQRWRAALDRSAGSNAAHRSDSRRRSGAQQAATRQIARDFAGQQDKAVERAERRDRGEHATACTGCRADKVAKKVAIGRDRSLRRVRAAPAWSRPCTTADRAGRSRSPIIVARGTVRSGSRTRSPAASALSNPSSANSVSVAALADIAHADRLGFRHRRQCLGARRQHTKGDKNGPEQRQQLERRESATCAPPALRTPSRLTRVNSQTKPIASSAAVDPPLFSDG